MKLIGSLTSPYVRKVRIVLTEKKVDYELVLENVWANDTRIADANPLGKVPCLIMEDGGSVFDSRVIAEYADTLSPVCKLIPSSGRERLEVRCWEALADGILDAAVACRIEQSFRAEHERSAAWIDRQTDKIRAGVDAMAKGLVDKPWCNGHHFSLADIAAGCALGYLDLRMPELDWRTAHPNLHKHYDKLAVRPSFVATQPPAA